MNHIEELLERVTSETEKYENVHQAAAAWGVNSAHFHNVLNGKDSPTLRRKWGIRKTTRTRFTADATPELIARFDAVCEAAGKTRAEVLADMVDIWVAVYEE